MVPTWLACGLIILEMKADNELAISLPVYFESVKKKTENMIKKQNRTSRKGGKKLSLARSNPGPWACDVNA